MCVCDSKKYAKKSTNGENQREKREDCTWPGTTEKKAANRRCRRKWPAGRILSINPRWYYCYPPCARGTWCELQGFIVGIRSSAWLFEVALLLHVDTPKYMFEVSAANHSRRDACVSRAPMPCIVVALSIVVLVSKDSCLSGTQHLLRGHVAGILREKEWTCHVFLLRPSIYK